MATEIRMPQSGMTMHEATIVEWLKGVGDPVSEGDVLATAETDKVTVEIESPVSGVLSAIHAEAGSTVPVLEIIATIG
jgi:pyruvate/2-oxoglutarate dehydrogenase complex dihydrolipoamide acyltransferase (E2) component